MITDKHSWSGWKTEGADEFDKPSSSVWYTLSYNKSFLHYCECPNASFGLQKYQRWFVWIYLPKPRSQTFHYVCTGKTIWKFRNTYYKWSIFLNCTSTENRLLDAGYFYATFHKSNLAMNIVQLTSGRTNEEQRKAVLKATEEIAKFGPQVILLYTSKEITQLLLQQVR